MSLPTVMSGNNDEPTFNTGTASPSITIANAGGGAGHENVQPTVFVPYIIRLDG